MARTHSSYTTSPTRSQFPPRSPPPDASEDGSQYEMDLDALGLNSTFESTELDDKHQPKVDVVETSDIEGPEDFTMNMTYWMTADLPLARQIRSRKEANANISEVRGDAQVEESGAQETTAEGDRVVVECHSEEGESEMHADPASTTTRVNGAAKSRSSSKPPSEASMENEEKVRSYLSALPDSDLGAHVLTSTPLRIPKHNMLQVPSPSPTRTRSLQPTVEDYDTPRKPTQETVIHRPPERTAEMERETLQQQVEDLKLRLQEQGQASSTRITELETLLAYTRADLDNERTESYKQKEQIKKLQEDNDRQKKQLETSGASTDGKLKAQEDEFDTRMQELGEELRLQNFAKLQSQREEFEEQLRTLEEAKRTVDVDMASSGEVLAHVRNELSQLRRSHERELRELRESHEQEIEDLRKSECSEHQRERSDSGTEEVELQQKFADLQLRANDLQLDLEKVTEEARSAREEAIASQALRASVEAANHAHQDRISDLQSRIDSLQSQVASAQADLEAKDRQLQDQLQNQQVLESQLRSMRLELEDRRSKATVNEQSNAGHDQLESRLHSLQTQLDSARSDARIKDQEILKLLGEHEQFEQRVNTAQGRIGSLEETVSSLRQQLAEAHRSSAKARTDAEQFEGLLEDANERLRDARAEADRRISDVEKRLTKLRDSKVELEARLKQLQNEYDDLKDEHETQMEAVRDRAEDAVRKAGSLLEQERAEKRRATKELKKTAQELEQLRSEIAQKAEEEEASHEENTVLSSIVDPKDAEMENLRMLIRKQAASLKTLKAESSALRSEVTRLTSLDGTPQNEAIADLQSQLSALRRENETLKADAENREQDFQAINKAMDERLATILSRMLKDRTKSAVSKRDGQWAEKMQGEREFMGKVLMREWGRQEVGAAKEGDKQGYRYKYVQRA